MATETVIVPPELQHLSDRGKVIDSLLRYAIQTLAINSSTTAEEIFRKTATVRPLKKLAQFGDVSKYGTVPYDEVDQDVELRDFDDADTPSPKRWKPEDAISDASLPSASVLQLPVYLRASLSLPPSGQSASSGSIATLMFSDVRDKPTLTSTRLGQRGEEDVLAVLQKIPFIKIRDNTKESHRADFCITMDDVDVLVEVKNYDSKSLVPTTEVNKFRDDLKVSKVLYGIFVSPSARIANKRLVDADFGDAETASVLYLSSFVDHTNLEVLINFAVYWMQQLIWTKKRYESTGCEIENEYMIALTDFLQECDDVLQRIDELKSLVRTHEQQVRTFVGNCNKQIERMASTFTNVQARLKYKSAAICTDELAAIRKHYRCGEGHVSLKEVQQKIQEEMKRNGISGRVTQKVVTELCESIGGTRRIHNRVAVIGGLIAID